MDTPQPETESRKLPGGGRRAVARRFVEQRPDLIAAVLSFLIFLTTIQTDINSSGTPYSTDIGEIQNALPRWGTLHLTGYPQFSFLGSLFVTILRPLGIEPALGASLFSAVWGAVSVGLLVAIMRRLAIGAETAVIAGLLFALSTSMWVDSSVAELHTMTMAITLGILLAALHHHQTERPAVLYWLAFLSSHGFVHQRSVGFMGLGLLLLVLPHWRDIARRWLPVTLLVLTGPLTYLYLPLRARMGADWVFGVPGNWYGFWAIVLDTKAERIVSLPGTAGGWRERIGFLNQLLLDDWPALLLVPGVVGLLALGTRVTTRERWALILIALANYGLSLMIWIGRASDALLAVKLPVIAMMAIGLGLLIQSLRAWRPAAGKAATLAAILAAAWLLYANRPAVTAVSQAEGARQTIATAARARALTPEETVTMLALWGNDYWQLAYERAYGERLRGLNVISQRDDLAGVLDRGDRLLTLERTVERRSSAWWEEQLGWPAYFDAPVPGLVEISDRPEYAVTEPDHRLENGVGVDAVEVSWCDRETLWVQLTWVGPWVPVADQRVAVEILPPNQQGGEADVVAGVIRDHPVLGHYPVSRWLPAEVIRDAYALQMEPGVEAVTGRLRMYDAGGGRATEWLRFDVPPPPGEQVLAEPFCRW